MKYQPSHLSEMYDELQDENEELIALNRKLDGELAWVKFQLNRLRKENAKLALQVRNNETAKYSS